MNDIIQDVRDYFIDRFSSPLWISFLVAWLIINWQLPVTAIFETERFNVAFISEYMKATSHLCIFTYPILIAASYAIFSSSIKETLELLSKTIRGAISKIDRKGIFYRSISINEHEHQLSRLKRQLQKIENDKAELNEIAAENARIREEIKDSTNKATNATLELEKLKNENLSHVKTKDALAENLINTQSELKESLNKYDELKNKHSELDEKILEVEHLDERLNQFIVENKILSGENTLLNEKLSKITKTLKLYSVTTPENDHFKMEKLIHLLEKDGLFLNEKNEANLSNSFSLKPSYFQTIVGNCDPQIQEELRNPNSRASIFFVLELLNGLQDYDINSLAKASGTPLNFINNVLTLIIDAEWTRKDFFENPTLSEAGKNKLEELKKDKSLSQLKNTILEIDKVSEENILSALQENHLSFQTLKEKIYFTPNAREIISRLLKEEKITRSGKIFSRIN